jgi:hypothetical protein
MLKQAFKPTCFLREKFGEPQLDQTRKKTGRPKGSKNAERKVGALEVSFANDSKGEPKRTCGRHKGGKKKEKGAV